jgi:hypothetical protein
MNVKRFWSACHHHSIAADSFVGEPASFQDSKTVDEPQIETVMQL